MMFGFDSGDIANTIRSAITQSVGTRAKQQFEMPGYDWMSMVRQEPSVMARSMNSGPVFGAMSSPMSAMLRPPATPLGGAGVLSGLFGGGMGARSQPAPQQPRVPAQPFVPTPNRPVERITDPNGSLDQALALAVQMFGEGADKVLNTTISAEGGWGAGVGDTHLNPIGSHGPLQFYGGGGQLNNFASAKGIKDLSEAGGYVRQNPLEAVEWALNNYYGNALRAGMDLGLRGADLAEYVQMNGQRSDPNLTGGKAKAIYRSLYGE